MKKIAISLFIVLSVVSGGYLAASSIDPTLISGCGCGCKDKKKNRSGSESEVVLEKCVSYKVIG